MIGKELKLEANLNNIPRVMAFVDKELEALKCPLKIRMKIDLAIDELIANVANYAYASGKGEVTVRFAFDETDRMVSITFIDEGVPYDPLKQRDPDVTLSAAERQIGGLGIFLVKKTMDSMEYKRENDCNILTIYKKI